MASQGQHGFGVAGGEGGHVAQHQVAGAVAAEGTLVGVADDGEGVEYVGGLVAVQAVQVEVQRVEAGDAVAAVFGVPDEGFAVVAEVAGEAGQVVGGVAQAQDLLADKVADGGGAERVGVALGGDQGELFDYEPVHASALLFLTSYEVESKRVCVSKEQWRRSHILCQSVVRSEEHTSELQSLMRNSYAVFCLKKKK